MERRELLPVIRLWANPGREKAWMENVLSELNGKLDGEFIQSISKERYQWGLMDHPSPPENWPSISGKWILSSRLRPDELVIPADIRVSGFIPSFEESGKAVSALLAILNGWELKTTTSLRLPLETIVSRKGNGRIDLPLSQAIADNTDQPALRTLSLREFKVLDELANGSSNKIIADQLRISESTVKFHIRSIFRKLGVQNRAQAVFEAMKMGLLVH